MSYESLKNAVGRNPIQVIEMDVDSCSLAYATGACTAALGVTGDRKCFNTRKTCQDTANYTKTIKTVRFSTKSDILPVGYNIYPCVESINITPTRLSTKGLAERAVVTIKMHDFPHHDRGIDPYVSDRGYDATTRGTFWGRFKARNPYLVNRIIRVKTGYIDPTGFDGTFSTDFQTRTYFIEKVDLDSKGNVKIVAKDILKFAEDKRSVAPNRSTGDLSVILLASDTSMTLSAGQGVNYSATGTVRVDDELISYTSISGDVLSGLTRGVSNTTAEEHSVDTVVQTCLVYASTPVQDIVEDLLLNYAGVDASYIPKADWDADVFLSGYTLDATITEPTGVATLLQEITEQTSINLWWDEIASEIKLKAIAPPLTTTTVKVLKDSDIIENTLKIVESEKDRLSRVTVLYGIINPAEGISDEANYLGRHITIASDYESSDLYGSEKGKTVKTRWIPTSSIASQLSDRLVNRFKDTPKEVSFKLDAKDSDVWTGDQIFLDTRLVQDDTGQNESTRYVITEVKEEKMGSIYSYKALQFNTLSDFGLIAPNATLDYTLESGDNQRKYMFISDSSGLMSNGDKGNRIV